MLLWILFWLGVVLIIGGILVAEIWDSEDAGFGMAILGIFAVLISGITIFCVGVDGYSKSAELRKISASYQFETDRRDELITLLDQQLNAYPDFIAELYSALDVEALLVKYPDIGADEVYLAKTNEIVSLNKHLINLRSDYLYTNIAVCNNRKNPFMPVTIWYPDCNINNFAENTPEELNVLLKP